MRNLIRSLLRFVLLPVLATVALAMAACSSPTTGTPQPSTTDDPNSNAATGESTTASRDGASDTWYTSIKSCDLLDSATASQFGFTSAGAMFENNEAQNTCKWHQTGQAELSITLTAQTYDSLIAANGLVSDLSIAGRPAKESGNSSGACDLAIKATTRSRALIVVTTLADGNQACNIAKNVAQEIAPKLPALAS